MRSTGSSAASTVEGQKASGVNQPHNTREGTPNAFSEKEK